MNGLMLLFCVLIFILFQYAHEAVGQVRGESPESMGLQMVERDAMDADPEFVVPAVRNQFEREIIRVLQPNRRRVVSRPVIHEILKRHRENFLNFLIEADIILVHADDFADIAMNDCTLVHDIVHFPQNIDIVPFYVQLFHCFADRRFFKALPRLYCAARE